MGRTYSRHVGDNDIINVHRIPIVKTEWKRVLKRPRHRLN